MILTYEKGRGDKIHIRVDGEYKMTVDALFWYGLGIGNNSEISDEELAGLTHSVSARRAFNRAVDLISRREHSRREVVIKLNGKGFGSVSEETADLLVQKGYINDERFARMYADELRTRKLMGKKAIAAQLYIKGIDKDIISEVLEEIEEDPEDLIREIVDKKYARVLGDEKGYRRAINGLLRLGYRFDDIKRVLSEYRSYDENRGIPSE